MAYVDAWEKVDNERFCLRLDAAGIKSGKKRKSFLYVCEIDPMQIRRCSVTLHFPFLMV